MENLLLSQISEWSDLIPLVGILFFLHRQSMSKLDKVIESNIDIKKTIAVHHEKFENGEGRMDRIESEVDKLRVRQHEIGNVLHKVKGQQLTAEHVETIVDARMNKEH